MCRLFTHSLLPHFSPFFSQPWRVRLFDLLAWKSETGAQYINTCSCDLYNLLEKISQNLILSIKLTFKNRFSLMNQPVEDCRFMKSISFYRNSTALDKKVFLIGLFYHSCLKLACPSEFHALHESFSSRVNHLHSWESMDSKHYYFLSGHDERTLVLIKHFIILTDQSSDCLDKTKI